MRVWRNAAGLAALLCCGMTAPALAAAQPAAALRVAVSPQTPDESPDEVLSPDEPRKDRTTRHSRTKTPVSVELTRVPRSVRPNSKVVMTGTVTNVSGQPLAGVQYRLRYSSQVMTFRGQLAQVAAAPVTNLARIGKTEQLGPLQANGRGSWRLAATAKELGFTNFGAYPIGVEFFTAAGQALGGQVTFVTGVPAGKKLFKDTSIGWVLPIIDRTHRTDDGTFIDEKLETDLGRGGRLSGLVEAAARTKTPVTWAIDPALLDDADAMTARGGYTVRAPKKARVKKPPSAAAKAWLDQLKDASQRDPYFAVPYADVDADALVRSGMSKNLTLGYKFMGVAGKVLGREPTHKLAWPVAGVSEDKTLSAMVKDGSDSFLMSSRVFQPSVQTFTPDAMATVPVGKSPKPVVMYDAGLSDIVSQSTSAPGDRVLAEQRFLAETAMITNEQPNIARTVVIAPSRHWSPNPAFAAKVLEWTDTAPWLKPARVDQIAKAAPKQQFKYAGYPESYQDYELGRTYLAEVKKIGLRATHFGNVLDPRSFPYEKAVLRLESASWRGSSAQARRARSVRDEFRRQLESEINKVHVAINDRGPVQLAGRTGRLPISVINELPDKTVSLRIKVTSQNSQRLQIGRYESKLKLNPKETSGIQVEVKSYAQGATKINVELQTPEGKQYRPPQTITVNTTGFGRVALLMTGGGLAVLFVGVGFRAMRARRRNKLEAAGDGSPGGEPPWENGPSHPPNP